jgi:RNA recognition motif-containing protein
MNDSTQTAGVKLYVGNLPWSVSDDQLQQMFAQAGQVLSAQVIIDRFSGRSKGFGFVEMATAEEAQAAIAQFNDQEMEGRKLVVNEARPKAPRSDFGGDRGGFGGGRGGFGGGRGGDRGGFGRGGDRGGDRGGRRSY